MSSALDMSLDDLIKNNKKPNFARSNARSAAGPGPTRRFSNRSGNRSNPYSVSKAPESTWKHDMYSEQAAFTSLGGGSAGGRSIETGTKLYISNLDYGVSNEDIKMANEETSDREELFSEAGDVKRYSVHFDRSGRSKGTAEVIFSRKQDALAAVKRYNNVQLDGKPMKIEIVGTNIPAAPAPQVSQAFNGGFGYPNGAPRSFPPRSRYNGPSRGGGGGRGRGRGGGRGRGRDRGEPVSATDLDADLDKYHSESMQT